MKSSLSQFSAITLFVKDVVVAKSFYMRVFDIPIHYESADSVVFKLGNTLLNLLKDTEAEGLLAPVAIVPNSAGQQALFTITVADVDAECERLVTKGIILVNGPIDRPWGIRAAIFTDPDGHCWELAQ